MASLKELRNRITSVEATRKITRAMQMVAASKLRRAQEAAAAARPYAARMAQVLKNLTHGVVVGEGTHPLLAGTGKDPKDEVHLLIVVTSERGLCGGFNGSIARRARMDAMRLRGSGKQIKILCVGRKGYDVLKRYFADELLPLITYLEKKSVGFAQAQEVATQVLADYDMGGFDIATLYYANFINVLTQETTSYQIIPQVLKADAPEDTSKEEDTSTDLKGAVYDYEPDESTILESLLPRYVAVQILRALLENAAGEQGARMSAMDSATRNAGEMIDALSITYNRSRQAQITKELIEIISGAEALQ